jgi:hypothetical protein
MSENDENKTQNKNFRLCFLGGVGQKLLDAAAESKVEITPHAQWESISTERNTVFLVVCDDEFVHEEGILHIPKIEEGNLYLFDSGFLSTLIAVTQRRGIVPSPAEMGNVCVCFGSFTITS